MVILHVVPLLIHKRPLMLLITISFGIRGIPNKWLESNLSQPKQFFSINGFDSDMSTITCGVPQGSVFLRFF